MLQWRLNSFPAGPTQGKLCAADVGDHFSSGTGCLGSLLPLFPGLNYDRSMGAPLHRCIRRVSQALSFVTVDPGDILTAKIHLFSSGRRHVRSCCPTSQGKVPHFHHLLRVMALVQVQCDDTGLVPVAASVCLAANCQSRSRAPRPEFEPRGLLPAVCLHDTCFPEFVRQDTVTTVS